MQEQQTPLHIAARLGSVEAVQLLLHHGATRDAATKDLYTPLHIAVKEGHEDVVEILLDSGAKHNTITRVSSIAFFTCDLFVQIITLFRVII